ncbi:HK97 family phage portal protein [Ochrobactrum sp. P6BSIII]|uniref:phage portal protein n=1 Tax=unclassified Ochrobactrum TaxID=239106 RepID=UPI000991C23F|nr:HK97 family phage portal protein [Ochrobactrum sp. P6BSIII]
MKLWPFGKKDYDLNGNRFYQEYIFEREIIATQRYLRVAASLAAGLRICEGVAAMPIITGTKSYDGDGRIIRKPTMEGDLYERLTVAPNDYMTPGEFIETLTLHAVFEGVGRAYIDRGYKGKIRRLIPITDGGFQPRKDPDTGKVFYSGTITGLGSIENATRKDFIEITSPRWDDTEGLDISTEIRKVLELSLRLEDRQDEDGAKKSIPGYITSDQTLSPDAAKMVHAAIKDKLPGTPIFDSGAQYKSIIPTQAEMQLMETRRFLIEEVARAYGIHPIFLAHDAAGQSLTRISDAMDYHVTVTLSPWLRRWEQAIQFSLLRADEFVNLDETQYYRGDLTTKADYAAKALGNNTGWETQNDVRSRMGMNPVTGGDFIPSSTTKEANNAA